MIPAREVAIELRKLADALDAEPDTEIIKPYLAFYGYEKDSFLATARLLPRPLTKGRDKVGEEKYRRIHVTYKTNAIDIEASAPQMVTCELIEPAKPAVYRCVPILSEEEDSEVTA